MSRQIAGVRLNSTDFYPTPSWCYTNLDINWSLFSSAHEPCAGDHRIVNFLIEKGVSTTYSEILEGTDFLQWSNTTDLIITNPPFSLAQEFIGYAIPRANTTIMLLRLNFLASIKRYEWWKQHSPTSLFVLSKRPSFTGEGTDATDYAWFVWDKTNRIPKGIYFVNPPSAEQNKLDNAAAKNTLKKII